MPDGRGHLLPTNATPEGFSCVAFFYPDDPVYRRALIGQYQALGQWWNWERDELKRGTIAAQLFREAIDLSYATDYMSIVNVTNNIETPASSGCCCGSASSSSPIVSDDNGVTIFYSPEEEKTPVYNTEPYVDPDDGITESPLGSTDWTSFNEEKCRRANYFADNVILDLTRTANLADTILDELVGGVLKFMASFLPKTWRDTIGAYALSQFGAPAILESNEGGALNVFETWAANINREEIVGIMYNYTTTENAYVDFHTWADASIASLPVNATLQGYLTSYKRIYGRWMFSTVTNFANAWPIPADYVGQTDCLNPPATLEYDFNDGTQQGWSFAKTPYSSGGNQTGGITAIALEGSHSIQTDMTAANTSVGSNTGGTWTINLPVPINVSSGDVFQFDFEYVGLNSSSFVARIGVSGSSSDVSFGANPDGDIAGTYSLTVQPSDDGKSMTSLEIRTAVNFSVTSSNGGIIKMDQIKFFASNP